MRTIPRSSRLLASVLLSCSLPLAQALPISIENEQLQVPRCLADKLSSNTTVLAENQAFKIIEMPSSELSNLSRLADRVHCGRFINVTHQFAAKSASLKQQANTLLAKKPMLASDLKPSVEYPLQHSKEVEDAIAQVIPANIWDTLTQMTTFTNRSATQETGVQAAAWLRQQFKKTARDYHREDVAAYYVETGRRYLQPSLVTVIGKDIKAPAIVIGAHMDTLGNSPTDRMPGAGDDGSGSSSVMEVARVLLASKTALQRPIYIIWYAAEEQGLVGSQKVVQFFKKNAIPVHAAIQFDMTGFRNDPDDATMWVFRDYTDKKLSAFMANLIQTYLKVPVAYSRCGYGCSDHASWTAGGIPAAFPCETNFEDHNPDIHTPSDTMDLMSLDHMTNFTKLGLAFAIELAS